MYICIFCQSGPIFYFIFLSSFLHICVYVCVYVYTYCLYLYKYTYMCIMYICVCVCIYVLNSGKKQRLWDTLQDTRKYKSSNYNQHKVEEPQVSSICPVFTVSIIGGKKNKIKTKNNSTNYKVHTHSNTRSTVFTIRLNLKTNSS